MRQLILTAIGNDQAGLISTLAATVRFHGGNWEYSDMTELAGTFAGVVQVSVPESRIDAFIADLDDLDAELDVQVRLAQHPTPPSDTLRVELVADDRPGIVQELTAALAALDVSVHRLETATTPAPMAGGELFSFVATASLPDGVTPTEVRAALEAVSNEVLVELSATGPDDGATVRSG